MTWLYVMSVEPAVESCIYPRLSDRPFEASSSQNLQLSFGHYFTTIVSIEKEMNWERKKRKNRLFSARETQISCKSIRNSVGKELNDVRPPSRPILTHASRVFRYAASFPKLSPLCLLFISFPTRSTEVPPIIVFLFFLSTFQNHIHTWKFFRVVFSLCLSFLSWA